MLNYDLKIKKNIIDALWVVLFVGMVEFFFLNIVASQYISANPNEIERIMLENVLEYIKKRKK